MTKHLFIATWCYLMAPGAPHHTTPGFVGVVWCDPHTDTTPHHLEHWEAAAYSLMDGNREWVTLIECICADGTVLPTFFIVQGKGVLLDLVLDAVAVKGTIVSTDNG